MDSESRQLLMVTQIILKDYNAAHCIQALKHPEAVAKILKYLLFFVIKKKRKLALTDGKTSFIRFVLINE